MAPGNRKKPRQALTSDAQYLLVDFLRDFPDDEACLQWLWRQRYAPDGTHAFCERCEGCDGVQAVRDEAAAPELDVHGLCGLHVHPTAGTIFHKSSTGLHLRFYAMHLMTSSRCGISAKQVERELGVTYKTAHRIFTMIHTQLMAQDDDELLDGEIEVDEAYFGVEPRLSDKAQSKDVPTQC